jgi:hypothetical protein
MSAMQMLLMAAGNTGVTLSNKTLSDSDTKLSPNVASATSAFELGSDGVARGFRESLSDLVFNGEWLSSGTSSGYDVMFTQLSGDAVTGTLGSWLNLGTSRSVSLNVTQATPGSSAKSATVRVEIRTTSGLLLVTAEVTLSVDATQDV